MTLVTAVTPMTNVLVAAAMRSGTPHHVLSAGTTRMPPPMPASVETIPAENDTTKATGARLTR